MHTWTQEHYSTRVLRTLQPDPGKIEKRHSCVSATCVQSIACNGPSCQQPNALAATTNRPLSTSRDPLTCLEMPSVTHNISMQAHMIECVPSHLQAWMRPKPHLWHHHIQRGAVPMAHRHVGRRKRGAPSVQTLREDARCAFAAYQRRHCLRLPRRLWVPP